MSTPRLVVPGVVLRPGILLVDRDYARHARVLRLRAGDKLILCDGAGHEMLGEIQDLKEDSLTIDLQEEVVREEIQRRTPITLYQGIAKGERMEWIIQKATELGVDRIVPVAMARSVAKYDKVPPRWEKIVQEAARQSERTTLPVIDPIATVKELVASLRQTSEARHSRGGGNPESDSNFSNSLGSRLRGSDGWGEPTKLLLDETGQGPRLKEVLSPEAAEVWVWVGPEGGTAPDERALIVAAGFTPVYLGARILRTETAAVSIVAILQHYYGDLG